MCHSSAGFSQATELGAICMDDPTADDSVRRKCSFYCGIHISVTIGLSCFVSFACARCDAMKAFQNKCREERVAVHVGQPNLTAK